MYFDNCLIIVISICLLSYSVSGQQTPSDICGDTLYPVGVFFSDRQNGCGSYVVCYQDFAASLLCPFELAFNSVTSECDEPEFVECEELPRTNLVCPTNGIFLLPYPYQCSKYIRCVDGFQQVLDCPPDHIFVLQLNRCASRFEGRCRREALICPMNNVENVLFIANSRDCQKYYICFNHIMYEENCTSDLQFNPTSRTCDLPERVNCIPENIPILPDVTIPTPPTGTTNSLPNNI